MTTTEVSHTTAQTPPWVPELTFGARLALVRHRMGWNVKEAAAACGVPAQSWRGWEIQGREPHRITTIAMTIATRTGCDYLWLVHGPARGGAQPTHKKPTFSQSRVVATIPPESTSMTSPVTVPVGPLPPGRAVRQTRPLVGPNVRPRTPVAV